MPQDSSSQKRLRKGETGGKNIWAGVEKTFAWLQFDEKIQEMFCTRISNPGSRYYQDVQYLSNDCELGYQNVRIWLVKKMSTNLKG